VLQFGGGDRTVITASNAMGYAFGEGELADTEMAPRCQPALWRKGLQTGEADGSQDGQVGPDELNEYAGDQVGGNR